MGKTKQKKTEEERENILSVLDDVEFEEVEVSLMNPDIFLMDTKNRVINKAKIKRMRKWVHNMNLISAIVLVEVAKGIYKIADGQHRIIRLTRWRQKGDPETIRVVVIKRMREGVDIGKVIVALNSERTTFSNRDKVFALDSPWLQHFPWEMQVQRQWPSNICRAFVSVRTNRIWDANRLTDEHIAHWGKEPDEDMTAFLEWVIRLMDPFRKRARIKVVEFDEEKVIAADVIPHLSSKILRVLLIAYRTNSEEARRACVKRFHKGNQRCIEDGRVSSRSRFISARGPELTWISQWFSLLNYNAQDKHRMMLWNGQAYQGQW